MREGRGGEGGATTHLEGAAELPQPLEDRLQRKGAVALSRLADGAVQRPFGAVLHDDVQRVVVREGAVVRDDVRMLQRREDAHLVLDGAQLALRHVADAHLLRHDAVPRPLVPHQHRRTEGAAAQLSHLLVLCKDRLAVAAASRATARPTASTTAAPAAAACAGCIVPDDTEPEAWLEAAARSLRRGGAVAAHRHRRARRAGRGTAGRACRGPRGRRVVARGASPVAAVVVGARSHGGRRVRPELARLVGGRGAARDAQRRREQRRGDHRRAAVAAECAVAAAVAASTAAAAAASASATSAGQRRLLEQRMWWQLAERAAAHERAAALLLRLQLHRASPPRLERVAHLRGRAQRARPAAAATAHDRQLERRTLRAPTTHARAQHAHEHQQHEHQCAA